MKLYLVVKESKQSGLRQEEIVLKRNSEFVILIQYKFVDTFFLDFYIYKK